MLFLSTNLIQQFHPKKNLYPFVYSTIMSELCSSFQLKNVYYKNLWQLQTTWDCWFPAGSGRLWSLLFPHHLTCPIPFNIISDSKLLLIYFLFPIFLFLFTFLSSTIWFLFLYKFHLPNPPIPPLFLLFQFFFIFPFFFWVSWVCNPFDPSRFSSVLVFLPFCF